MPPLAFVIDTQSWVRTLASAVDPEATPVNEPMTPITIGAADVLLVLPAEAALAGDEDGEEELHPASARVARTIAGNPARTPVRRVRVIAASPFWPDLVVTDRGAGRSWYLMVTSPLETELRSALRTCQAWGRRPLASRSRYVTRERTRLTPWSRPPPRPGPRVAPKQHI